MKRPKMSKTLLQINNSYEGQTIEMRIEKLMNSKEPITDASDIIYTDRKEGVLPDYDIRTDKWEYALDGMTKAAEMRIAARNKIQKEKDEKEKEQKLRLTKPNGTDGGTPDNTTV